LAQALSARGHEAHVLCAEDWDAGQDYWNGHSQDLFNGIPVHRIHLNWMKAHNPNQILYDSQPSEDWIDQFLTNIQFDIVHVTSVHSLGVGVLRSVRRSGTPLILTLMDFWFVCPNAQLVRSDGALCDGRTTAWQCQSCLMAQSGFF
jgi:hypothetical protein